MTKINIIIILIFAVFVTSCCDCDKTKQEKPVITGKMKWSDWQSLALWKDYSAKNYTPNPEKIKTLKQILTRNPEIKFKIFASSWCHDSEVGVPKLYKLFSLIGLDESRIELYGVNRQKTEPTGEAIKFNIEKVPTLIVMLDSSEINRIIEYPQIDWETDLFKILSDFK